MTTPDEDELRARLVRLDPMPASIPVDHPTSPRAHDQLERAMLTTDPTPDHSLARPSRKIALSAAAAVVTLGVAVAAVTAGAGGKHATTARPKTSMALVAPAAAGGLSLGSCIRFSVDILRGMPVAFGGTVTDVSPTSVSLSVDRWFKGGNADVVTVTVPPGNTSVGTVVFAKGKRYLVTANDGTVTSCGFTVEATPDLERAFEQAFTP